MFQKVSLFKPIVELEIDNDLIIWIKSFFTNRKIQLIMNKYDNKKREV